MAELIDLQDLRAFSVVAAELNMRKAADILHISQPPLSRKIKKLEIQLGVTLFNRHSYGLELTGTGKQALGIIQPLLALQDATQERLVALAQEHPCRIGLTTAFEQGIFSTILESSEKAGIRRASSIHLAREILTNSLDIAFVALPVPMPALEQINLSYSEPLIAVVPKKWNIEAETVNLCELNGRPFFWFQPRRNPFWHDRMQTVFQRIGFAPKFVEEPLEHDVLLARIAEGEAFALMPQSFMAIVRQETHFMAVRDIPPLALGIIYKAGNLSGAQMARNWGEVARSVLPQDNFQ